MKKKWFSRLVRSRLAILLLLLLQFRFIIYTVAERSAASSFINSFFTLLSLCVCIYVASRPGKEAFKLMWIFEIMLFPLFGGLFYLIFRLQKLPKKHIENDEKQQQKTKALLNGLSDSKTANSAFPQHKNLINYLQNAESFPAFDNTETEYLPIGEVYFERLKEELLKAEKYIFLEYFIIEEGYMWDSILTILKNKVKEGVKVRVIYDDMGCFVLLPKDYGKKLKECGIEVLIFNPFRPVISTLQNNRDHRKIAVIDGKTAFTGGINLSDEYINRYQKFGHWKDCGVMLKGKGAYGFTLMFLQMWNSASYTDEDYSVFLPQYDEIKEASGFVQPYCDSPLDGENVGEQVYLTLINGAKDYLYINTPYFIVDQGMLSAICMAAKRGVDVKLVTPHMADKKLIHMTTRSFYRELTDAGVKVYEYTPGFIHSKTFVADDTVAAVGTVNLDYRSLYHHFECGVCMYGTEAVMQLKTDYLDNLKKCTLITEKDCKANIFTKLFQTMLKLVAPLL